jgi:hypothetical protein
VTFEQFCTLTLQLRVVLVVHELVGVAPPADEAVLVAALHVLVQLVTIVEALPAKGTQHIITSKNK